MVYFKVHTMKHILLFILLSLAGLVILSHLALAAECETSCGSIDECSRKIADCQKIWEDVQKAKAPHESALKQMEADIAAFQARMVQIAKEITQKEIKIKSGEAELGKQQELLAQRVRIAYIRSFTNSPLLMLFSSSADFGQILRTLFYQKVVTNEDKQAIIETVSFIKDLEDKKATLEAEKTQLASLEANLKVQADATRKLVNEAAAYQSKLSSQIGELTTRQQSFLAEKLAGLNLPTSLGAGPLYCTDDRKLDPGFRPAFAFFTFGIPHRVGMNQYGAYGRANSGQKYRDILQAYFDGISFEKRSNINIKVSGYGSMSLEQYLLGVYEMPSSWPLDALKAQAVAARSYALAYTGNGANEICTTQACQVYKGGNKGGDWEKAVKETEGEVMVNGGQVITAWYASTAGGYTFSSGDVGWNNRPWTKRTRDTNGDVGSFADLMSKAYDRDSPCFYAAQGWRGEYSKSAWLKSEEIADIVNVILLARKDSGTREHLYQPDKPNPEGKETWDKDRVKQELRNRDITPFNNINDISISGVDWGSGRTAQITLKGDSDSTSFDGSEFRNFFNLRAPANIQIVGPLYNTEKK